MNRPLDIGELADTYNLVANGWRVADARAEVARRRRVAELRKLALRVRFNCLAGRRG